MAEMTPEMWQAKDRLIVRQTCIKAACDLGASVGTHGERMDLVLENAQCLFDWVYGEIKPEVKTSTGTTIPETTCPTPTVEQANALKKVKEETGWTENQVWDKFGKYPSNGNVDICINFIGRMALSFQHLNSPFCLKKGIKV